jgi:hypothetical protein
MANGSTGADVRAEGEAVVAERFFRVGEDGEDALGAGHVFPAFRRLRNRVLQSLVSAEKTEIPGATKVPHRSGCLPSHPHPDAPPSASVPFSFLAPETSRKRACSVRTVREVKARQVASGAASAAGDDARQHR